MVIKVDFGLHNVVQLLLAFGDRTCAVQGLRGSSSSLVLVSIPTRSSCPAGALAKTTKPSPCAQELLGESFLIVIEVVRLESLSLQGLSGKRLGRLEIAMGSKDVEVPPSCRRSRHGSPLW